MASRTLTASEARRRLEETRQRSAPFEEKAREALELGEQYLGADNAHLARIDTETGQWEATVSTDPQGEQFPEGLELDLQTTYCRQTIQTDGPIALHDAPAQGWDGDPAFETHDLDCYHGTALYLDEEPYGTLCFVANDAREEAFGPDELLFADLVSRLLERELERQRHQAELTRRTNLVNVLNRVLRHNIRNDMTVIRGQTKRTAEQLDSFAPAGAALDKIDGLIELCEKAREVEEILDRDHERTGTDLDALLREVAAEVGREFPSASITVEGKTDTTARLLPSFRRAVRELVENGVKHGGDDPSVSITVEHTPGSVEIGVTDTGPGIDEQERKVLEPGVETPLIHGTGLGLWLVHWIVTDHDGTVEATTTDAGTTMSLSVPCVPAPNSTEDLADLRRASDQYRAGFEEAFDAQFLLDDHGRIIEANPAAEGICGIQRTELRGQSLGEFFPDGVEFDGSVGLDEQTGRDVLTVSAADGRQREVEYSVAADIVPGQHLLIARNVTERQRRKAELERHETVLDSINDAAWVYDEDRRITFVNEASLSDVPMSREAAIGAPMGAFEGVFRGPETFADWERLVDGVLAGEIDEGELDATLERDDGSVITNLRVTPVPGDGDEPAGAAVIGNDITARKQRERALSEYETIVEALSDPVYVIDETGRFTHVNDELVELVGYDRETIVGNTPSLFKSRAAVSRAEDHLGRLLSADGPETVSFEVAIQSREGTPVVCEDKMGVLPYEGDSFNGSVGTLREVDTDGTDRTEFLESLTTELTELASDLLGVGETGIDRKVDRSLETMGTLVGADRSYVFQLDEPETFTNTHEWAADGVEPHVDSLQQLSTEEFAWWTAQLERRDVIDVRSVGNLPPAAAAERELLTRRGIESVIASPISFDGELTGFVGFDWVDGEPAWSEQFSHALRIWGELVSSGMQRATRRQELARKREQMVAAEHDRANALFEQLGDPIVEIRFDDGCPVVETINETFERTFEIADSDVTGRRLGELLDSASGESAVESLARRARAETVVEEELRIPTAAGERIFVVRMIPYSAGDTQRAYGICFDVTDRRHRERRFQAFIEQSSDVISVLDAEGNYQYQSPSAARILGNDPERMLGDDAFEFIHPDDTEAVQTAFAEAVADPELTPSVEYRFRRGDGSWIWLESIGNNQLDNPAIEGFVVNSREISERKQREQRVEEERDRLDKFAGTVSHDLRNPLTVAKGRLELAQGACESEHLEVVARAQSRMEELIEDVLSLARAGETISETEPVELGPLVETCWETVETGQAELAVESETTVCADENQLKQLLENVLRNTVEHGPDDVTSRIGDLPEGFYVEDDGPGIPSEDRSAVLDPGYSTAEAGTGFGLSIVRDVAEAHGWSVTVTASADGGARFEFSGVEER